MAKCIKCGRELSFDEIGLHKKLINRGAREYMCKECLSAFLDIKTEILERKIEEFREMGCLLFTKKE